MIDCCDLTYCAYLNDDGTVNHHALVVAVHDHLTTVDRKGNVQTPVFDPSRPVSRLCMCDCHKAGKMIVH